MQLQRYHLNNMKKILLVLSLFSLVCLSGCTGEELNKEGFVDYTKQFTLDAEEYVGKSFLKDGIGLVEVVSHGDGDTTNFKDLGISDADKATYTDWSNFKIRYYGCDTPETYMDPSEDYGDEASLFTNTILKAGTVIVLSSIDNGTAPKKDGYDRYLGYVWVDGLCVNLAVVQNGFSTNSATGASFSDEHNEIFGAAYYQAKNNKINLWSK